MIGRIEGRTYVCKVIDNGPGVPKEIEHKLFERFIHRGHETATKDSVGLGLSIVRALAHGMGGSIAYERVNNETHFVAPSAAGRLQTGFASVSSRAAGSRSAGSGAFFAASNHPYSIGLWATMTMFARLTAGNMRRVVVTTALVDIQPGVEFGYSGSRRERRLPGRVQHNRLQRQRRDDRLEPLIPWSELGEPDGPTAGQVQVVTDNTRCDGGGGQLPSYRRRW